MKKILSFILTIIFVFSLAVPAKGAASNIQNTLNEAAKYIHTAVKNPGFGSIGGDWAAFGLARSGYSVPEKYFQDYYAAIEKYVNDRKGVLSTTKYTEYARLILALSSIGVDARKVAGYDLTKPLGDYDKTIKQGVNGAAFALLALDSANYLMPKNSGAAVQATRQMYIDKILADQFKEGGWNLDADSKTAADPDVTAVILQALAKYTSQPEVEKSVEKALGYLSKLQTQDGGFGSSYSTAETYAQVIIALCELGIPTDDPRFTKNGNTFFSKLMTMYSGGSFLHTPKAESANQMASEQGLMALIAVNRAANNQNSLYTMSDSLRIKAGNARQLGSGLENKNSAVTAVQVKNPGVTFTDINGTSPHKNKYAIEALAERGILNGKTTALFYPDDAMTRAEFSAVIVRALGLKPVTATAFSDVSSDAWYADYVGSAYKYEIVNGVGGGRFDPDGLISRQEAAVMIARAAKLCGIDTSLNAAAVRDILAQFGDYVKTADWSRSGLAFCYASDILDQSELNIEPEKKILRCEVAEMVYRLLGAANLLY